MRAILILIVACAGACAHPAPPPDHRAEVGDADEQFRQTARQLGHATERVLTAWGTVRLDASPRTYRFATFAPAAAGRGLYLIEDGSGRTWLVRYPHDATTRAFGERELGTGVTEPPWQFQAGLGLAHSEDRPDGSARIAIGLSDHGPDVRDPGGTCAAACPSADGFAFAGGTLTVSGPFAQTSAVLAAARGD